MISSRQYVKLCDVTDFADPELCAAVGSIEGTPTPERLRERKQWERAMLATVLTEQGRLGDDVRALAIGAGSEPVLFWLANRVGQVVATDIYGEGKFAGLEAEASMLVDPAAFSPVPYPAERLSVVHMDARQLEFPDASFDIAYSLSSIEHFGSGAEISRSAAEMGRVLRPGGIAVVVTECLLRLHPADHALTELGIRLATLGRRRRGANGRQRVALAESFTPEELQRRIVTPSGLRLVQPLDLALSAASWDNLTVVRPGGHLEPATGSLYPHAVLQVNRSAFTSVCLVLEKPGS